MTRSASRILLAAAMTAALCYPATASAQAAPAGPLEPARWTATPFLGLVFGGDLEGGGLGVGGAVAYNWNPRVSFEGAFTLLPSVDQGVLVQLDSTVWNVTGSVLYHFTTEGNFIPYGAVGVGVGHGSVDLNDVDPLLNNVGLEDSSNNFVLNLGGGVKRRIGDRASLRGDIRYFTGDDLVSDFVRLFAGVTFDLGAR